MDSNTALLAALAIVSACVGILGWVIKFLFQKMLPVLEKMNANVETNTLTTQANDAYLRERNGRDSEIHKQLLQGFKDLRELIVAK